jgi:Fe-S oxidoreductase
MMNTRDRLEEHGANMDRGVQDEKNLHSYISAEELWACTTCNACAEACPVNINPVDIIMQMRQYLVMEQSAAPSELNGMLTNIENNGAPWQFSPMDRGNWAQNA